MPDKRLFNQEKAGDAVNSEKSTNEIWMFVPSFI